MFVFFITPVHCQRPHTTKKSDEFSTESQKWKERMRFPGHKFNGRASLWNVEFDKAVLSMEMSREDGSVKEVELIDKNVSFKLQVYLSRKYISNHILYIKYYIYIMIINAWLSHVKVWLLCRWKLPSDKFKHWSNGLIVVRWIYSTKLVPYVKKGAAKIPMRTKTPTANPAVNLNNFCILVHLLCCYWSSRTGQTISRQPVAQFGGRRTHNFEYRQMSQSDCMTIVACTVGLFKYHQIIFELVIFCFGIVWCN